MNTVFDWLRSFKLQCWSLNTIHNRLEFFGRNSLSIPLEKVHKIRRHILSSPSIEIILASSIYILNGIACLKTFALVVIEEHNEHLPFSGLFFFWQSAIKIDSILIYIETTSEEPLMNEVTNLSHFSPVSFPTSKAQGEVIEAVPFGLIEGINKLGF